MHVFIVFCGIAGAAFLVFAHLSPAKWKPRTGLGGSIDHFVYLAWPQPLVVAAALMGVSALLEGLQLFTVDRTPSFLAAFCGAGGALAAVLLLNFFSLTRKGWRRGQTGQKQVDLTLASAGNDHAGRGYSFRPEKVLKTFVLIRQHQRNWKCVTSLRLLKAIIDWKMTTRTSSASFRGMGTEDRGRALAEREPAPTLQRHERVGQMVPPCPCSRGYIYSRRLDNRGLLSR